MIPLLALTLSTTAFFLIGGTDATAQVTAITAGDVQVDALTTDFEAIAPGLVAPNNPILRAGGISGATFIGTSTNNGDLLNAGTSGQAAVANGSTLVVLPPGSGIDTIGANSGFQFDLINPATQVGFNVVDQTGFTGQLSLFSGGVLVGSVPRPVTAGFPEPQLFYQSVLPFDRFFFFTLIEVGGFGIDNIVLAGFMMPTAVVAPAPTPAPSPAPTPAPIRSSPAPPAPILVADLGAILSAETTGLLVPIVNRSVTQNAAIGAIRDLNGRLFRARSGGDVGPASEFAGASGGTLVRYLNFAKAIGADEAGILLDISGGEGVAVSVHDTMITGGAIMAVGPDGKAVAVDTSVNPKDVVGGPTPPAYAYNRFQVFSEFNYGFYDQDNLSDLVRGFQSDTYSGTVGAEFRVAPWLHVGGAFSYLESDTDLNSNFGNIDLNGTLVSVYATTFYDNFYLDTLYSFGQFDHDISRNTLLGRHATGDTESETHNVDVNLGYNIPLTQKITVGPTLGVNYATGDIDGYSERGGRNANLIFPDDDFESTIGRLGGQISYTTDTGLGKVTLQGRAGWAHEFTPEDDPVSATLETSPFLLVTGNNAQRLGDYTASGNSAYTGENWLELGAGIRLDLSRRWSMQVDYEGQFGRADASAHFAALKLSYDWGTEFLSALR